MSVAFDGGEKPSGFVKSPNCAKCAHEFVRVTYCGPKQRVTGCSLDGEHLHAHCERCGHESPMAVAG